MMRSYWRRVGPTSDMTSVLIRREEMWTHREAGRVTRGRDWRAAATSQGAPRVAGTTGSWRRQEGCSPEASEETWPCSHLDFECPASRSERRDFCWFRHPVCELCYSSCGKLIPSPGHCNPLSPAPETKFPQIKPCGRPVSCADSWTSPPGGQTSISGDSSPGEGP